LPSVIAQSNTTVNASASTPQPQVGAILTVGLKIFDVQNLAGIDAVLHWNSSVLALLNTELNLGSHSDGVLVGVNLDRDADNLNDGDIFVQEKNSSGSYELNAESIGLSTPSFSGNGTFVTIAFNVIGLGDAGLSLHSELTDHPPVGQTATTIDHQDTAGTVTAIAPIYPPAWNTQTVDVNVVGGGPNAGPEGYPIAVDASNLPHLTYTDIYFKYNTEDQFEVSEYVMYAAWDGISWNIQTVAAGTAFSMVLDAYGFPHILFSGEYGLMCASWSGTSWETQIVDPRGAVFGALALDSFDNLHAAYSNGTVLEYASEEGSNWKTETVDTYGSFVNTYELSLALDSSGSPAIFYARGQMPPTDGSSGQYAWLTLATLKNSVWSFQNIANVSFSQLSDNDWWFGNMVLDPKGNPHVIYQEGDENNSLMYMSWSGTDWNKQIIASNVTAAGFLALDSYGYPHITYNERESYYVESSLMYASWTGKEWEIQSTNLSASQTYLLIDSKGKPQISYLALGESARYYLVGNIMYATAIEPQAIPTLFLTPSPTATPSGNLFPNQSVSISVSIGIAVIIVIAVSTIFLRRYQKKTKQVKKL